MHLVNFKQIPYRLTPQIRTKRIEKSLNLYNILKNFTPKLLNRVFTEDETWIYYNNPRRSMWIDNGSKVPQTPKNNISAKKVMIAVIWSRSGIKSITMLPQKTPFNKDFFQIQY